MCFGGFSEEPTPLEQADAPLAVEPGADRLPLELLDDRRFEVLAYRLKLAQFGDSARVSLMQGVGERVRDVVVYSTQGDLREIVQCKRLRDRMTAPALRSELLKLALHAYREPSIIGTAMIRYELWCANGLTEPAAEILNRWPSSWTIASLTEPASEVLQNTARLSDVTWHDAVTFVVSEFPNRVSPTKLENVDISERLRACSDVYRSYFEVRLVMDPLDVKNAVREWVSDLPTPGCGTAADAQAIARQVEASTEMPVEVALQDGAVLHLWVRGVTPTRDTIKRDLLRVARVASDTPGVEEIVVGTIDTASFVGTIGGRGIGTIRAVFPAAATRALVHDQRTLSEFWESVSVCLMDPVTENTEAMRFARVPVTTFDRGGL